MSAKESLVEVQGECRIWRLVRLAGVLGVEGRRCMVTGQGSSRAAIRRCGIREGRCNGDPDYTIGGRLNHWR